jgi:hypothetical protein
MRPLPARVDTVFGSPGGRVVESLVSVSQPGGRPTPPPFLSLMTFEGCHPPDCAAFAQSGMAVTCKHTPLPLRSLSLDLIDVPADKFQGSAPCLCAFFGLGVSVPRLVPTLVRTISNGYVPFPSHRHVLHVFPS